MLRLQASGRPSDYISDIKEFHWHSSQQPEQPAVLPPSVTGRVGSEAEPWPRNQRILRVRYRLRETHHANHRRCGDETGRGDKAVLGAEAQLSDEVGGEAEDEAAQGSEEWVVARLLTPAVLASLSESVVNISWTFMINV